jgi:hypothetical protein
MCENQEEFSQIRRVKLKHLVIEYMNYWFILLQLKSIIIFVFEFVDEVLMSNYTWTSTLFDD